LKILAIETSCDETAAAVVADGVEVLASVIASQVQDHAPYGGVVPELASRRHVENILPVVRLALDQAGLKLREIDALAVTRGPGLVGALLVGLSFTKALALSLDKPLVAVNHVLAHLAAAFLKPLAPRPPLVALIVSGGHSSLLRFRDWPEDYAVLGRALDDAAGEAFDKVGKLLGLAYPAGPVIDRLARQGRPTLDLPRPLLDGSLDFSFSGLKTAVLNYVKIHPVQGPGQEPAPGQTSLADLCASFQEAVVDVLVAKTVACARREGVTQVVLAGGVAANQRLRQRLAEAVAAEGKELLAPRLELCTDNAAMVGAAGYHLLRAGRLAGPGLDATGRL
jgi:N6-L-threonylcarbamoyladenine synthase